MKLLRNALLGTAFCAGGLAASSLAASAAIVCSGDDCWHTTSAYEYPATSHVIVHEDGWRWADQDHFRWREHAGRGFWHGDSWEDF